MITKINRRNKWPKAMAFIICHLSLSAVLLSCSDTWDDHYEGRSEGMKEGTLWQAIKQNSNLSNFASVVEACGYDKSLGSSQVFTVFAPTNNNFSATEAQELIQGYLAEKGKVNEDDNTVIKEFIQNHIAMYTHSITGNSNDSLVMMNGKYAKLSSGFFGGSPILTSNEHYTNGLLFTIDGKAKYFPNVFEYLRKDADLDSLRSFFYDSHFYRNEFIPERSVPGGFENGKTIYLDSVFVQQNDLFDYNFLDAELNEEDSTYWMVAPTNEVWRDLIDEYQDYFVYDKTVDKRDSLMYTMPRLAIVAGTTFSRTLNNDAQLRDSAMSTNAVLYYENREYYWGNNNLHYYQFGGINENNTKKPFAPEGIFSGTTPVECSNGQVLKTNTWHINPLNTFYQWIIIEAEEQGSIREVSKVENTTTGELEGTVTPINRRVLNNNSFYNKVWGNIFVEFEPARASGDHTVVFNIRNVLSNIGYDIYLVTAPALANDSNATEAQRIPTKMRCSVNYHDLNGVEKEDVLQQTITTTPDVMDYILLAEDYKFPVASYGLNEAEPQVTLTLKTKVTATELRNKKYGRTMRVDCIMLVPHGISHADDERFEITPHADGETFYWLRQ
jgi:hypothetical protein